MTRAEECGQVSRMTSDTLWGTYSPITSATYRPFEHEKSVFFVCFLLTVHLSTILVTDQLNA